MTVTKCDRCGFEVPTTAMNEKCERTFFVLRIGTEYIRNNGDQSSCDLDICGICKKELKLGDIVQAACKNIKEMPEEKG